MRDLPNRAAVYFGATVEVRDEAGDTNTYRIVGPDETNAKTAAISMDSPLARALLKKQVEDEVQVTIAEKTTTLTILAIQYEEHQ